MSTSFRFRGSLLALLAVLAITVVLLGKGPLQDTHWDAPIYLHNGKELAETHYLRDYARHAGDIAARLPEFKAGSDASTPYWGFMRLGNSILLGAVASVMGTDMASIQASFWLYSLMLAAALVLGGLLSFRIVRILAPSLPRQAVTGGAIISAALYLASDVYRYLSGTFVAEVPAMLLLMGSAYSLVKANEMRRASLAILSGALAFALYVVKMEAVLVYTSFVLLYATALFHQARDRLWWAAFLLSMLCALALFGLYSWWFWPLTDPRLFLVFADAHRTEALNPVAPIKLWLVAGGLLWLGLLPALRHCTHSPVLWLALGWLGVTFLPYAEAILNGRPAQVRMFALIMPPLLLASTIGFATLLARKARNETGRLTLLLLIVGAFALMAVSHAETYQRLRDIPGGWRLQYFKAFLSPPPYERLDYPLEELAAISRFLHSAGPPTILIRDNKVPEEYINIISYLGPPPARSSIEEFAVSSGTNMGMCGARNIQLALKPVMYCNELPTEKTLADLAGAGVRILYLKQHEGTSGYSLPPKVRIAFMTTGLTLQTSYYKREE